MEKETTGVLGKNKTLSHDNKVNKNKVLLYYE